MLQIFGTSFNLEVGSFRLRIAVGLDDRSAESAGIRVEDLPRFEIGSK